MAQAQTDYFGFAYAALVMGGGLIGFVKASSIPSLAAGTVFGALAGYGAYRSSQNAKDCLVILLTSGALLCVMGYRFYNSRKVMPAGMIAGLSLLSTGRYGMRMLDM